MHLHVLPKPRPPYFHAPPLPIDSEITIYFQFLIHKSPALKRINDIIIKAIHSVQIN